MPVVTLTSDLGTGDFHIAAVKGALLAVHQQLNIIDITHNIKPFHYIDAAYVLSNCFRDFPKGTIHLVGVEGDFSKTKEWVFAQLEDHFFFTKNNGILSLISDHDPEWAYIIVPEHKKDLKFPFRDIIAANAVKYLKGTKPEKIGLKTENLVVRSLRQPSISSSTITGVIVRNTPYNNAVTNIHRRHFDSFKGFSTCQINYNKMDHFNKIYNSYYDLPEGMAGCFFDHHGFIEIGIHGGNGKNLLSLTEGKHIRIELK